MKYLIPILFILAPIFTKANIRDTVPSGVPQLFGGKYYKFNGYVLVDSFIMNAAGDTNLIPYYPSLKFKSSNNKWYGWDRTRWRAFQYETDPISANNGLTYSSGNIQFGQSIGAGGDPGALVHNTEIPLNGFNTVFTGTGTVGIGLNNPSAFTSLDVLSSGINNAIKATSATGAAISATSASGNGILGFAGTTGIGVQGHSNGGYGVQGSGGINGIGGRFELLQQGNSTDNIMLDLSLLPTGTGITSGAGYTIAMRTGLTSGVSNTITGKIKHYLSNATPGAYSSELEFHLANNTTLARKALLSHTGQWTWDGYPSLTGQTDTSVYKPIAIDGSGNVIKMGGWPGTGGLVTGLNIYNNDSTLSSDRTITQAGKYLRFQENSNNYTQYNGALQTIQTDSASIPFYTKIIKSPYAGTPADGMVSWYEGLGFGDQTPGRPNYPYMMGWNLAPGGSAVVSGLPAIGMSFEPHYLPDGTSPTLWLQEMHRFYIQPDGTQRRLESWTINTRDNNWNYYMTTPAFEIRDTFGIAHVSASTASSTDRTSVFQLKSGNERTNTQFVSNGTEKLLTIHSVDTAQLQFTDWDNIDFGNGNGYRPSLDMWGIGNVAQGFNIIRATHPWGFHFKNSYGGGDVGSITYDGNTGECRDYVGAGGYYKTFYSNGSLVMQLNTNGSITHSLYGTGTYTGTPATTPVYTSAGNIVERIAPKIYTALLTQSGTSDPTASIMGTNEIGSIVWARTSTGVYTGTFSGAFVSGKTFIINGENVDAINVKCYRTDANTVTLKCYAVSTGTLTDVFTDLSIEIRVYP